MMTDVVHLLPWALLAAALTGGIEIAVLHLLRRRWAAANIAALVAIPILAVLIFVGLISGFMYTPALATTATACALIAVVLITVVCCSGDGSRSARWRPSRSVPPNAPRRRPAGNLWPG